MTTPSSNLGFSDINVELTKANTSPIAMNDAAVRNLTSVQASLASNSAISLNDLKGKVAFAGISGSDAVANNYGTVTSTVNLDILSDFVAPNCVWSTNIISQSAGLVALNQNGTRTATLSFTSNTPGTQSANVLIGVNVSIGALSIGSANQYFNLQSKVVADNFVVTGTTNALAVGYAPQQATVILKASSTVPSNATISFTVSPNLTNYYSVSGNNITFSATANAPFVDNVQTFSVTSTLKYNNTAIDSITKQVNIEASYQSFIFNVSLPSGYVDANNVLCNNQIGTGTVPASVGVTANFANVPSGKVRYTLDYAGNATMDLASATANSTTTVSVSSTGVVRSSGNSQSQYAAVTAALYDAANTLLGTQQVRFAVRAYAPSVSFSGANTSSNSGYIFPKTSATTVSAITTPIGYTSWSFAAAKLSGNSLNVTQGSMTGTSNTISLSAVQTGIGTTYGVYRFTSNVAFYDKSYSTSYDADANSTVLDSGFAVGVVSTNTGSFVFPVYANAIYTATFLAPGATVVWSGNTFSGTLAVSESTTGGTANGSTHTFVMHRDTIGSGSGNTSIGASLYITENGANSLINSITTTNSVQAQVYDPALVVTGTLTSNNSNTFDSYANTVLQASVNTSMTGYSIAFSAQSINPHPIPSYASGANNTFLLSTQSHGADGLMYAWANVACVLVKDAVTLGTVYKTVKLAATALLPTINFSSANGITGSFIATNANPLRAIGWANVSVSPAATIVWTNTLLSGSSNIVCQTVANNVANSTFSQQKINIVHDDSLGVGSGPSQIWQLRADLYTPTSNVLIQTNSANVTVTAQRYDPVFSWSAAPGDGVSNTIIGGNTSSATFTAAANSSIAGAGGVLASGYSYVYTGAGSSSNSIITSALSTSNGHGTVTMTRVSSSNSEIDLAITASLQFSNSSVSTLTLAGPVTRNPSLIIQTIPATSNTTPNHFSRSGNEHTQTLNCTVNVFNGIGPFTYHWDYDYPNAQDVFANTTLQTCSLQLYIATGDERGGTLTCTVTDTGNSNQTCTGSCTYSIVNTLGDPNSNK